MIEPDIKVVNVFDQLIEENALVQDVEDKLEGAEYVNGVKITDIHDNGHGGVCCTVHSVYPLQYIVLTVEISDGRREESGD